MRVLIIGAAGKDFRTEYYIRKAFERAGHKVFWFNDRKIGSLLGKHAGKALKAQTRLTNPDFVFLSRARGLDSNTLGDVCRGRKSAMWYFDFNKNLDDQVLALASQVDCLFITNDSQCEQYRDAGVKRVEFLPQACDRENHRDFGKASALSYGLSFIGRVDSSEYRRRLLESIAKQLDLHIWGLNKTFQDASFSLHPERIVNNDLVDVIQQSFAVLGINSVEGMASYRYCTSNRLWVTLGCGGFFIGNRSEGLGELTGEGKYLELYASEGELVEKYDYYKSHKERREAIRLAGNQWAHAFHTYDNRVGNLLSFTGFSSDSR